MNLVHSSVMQEERERERERERVRERESTRERERERERESTLYFSRQECRIIFNLYLLHLHKGK